MLWFANLRLSSKFSIIVLTLLSFLLGLGGSGIWGSTYINHILQDVQGKQIPSILNLTNALNKIQAARSELQLALLDFDPGRVEIHLTTTQQAIATANASLNSYKTIRDNTEEINLAKDLDIHWQSWLAQTNQAFTLARSNSSASYVLGLQLLASGKDQEILQDLANLIKFNEDVAIQNKVNQGNQAFIIVMIVIISSLLSVLMVNGLMLLILRRFISNPLISLRRATQAVAAGDLSKQVKIETADELGDLAHAFNLMTNELGQRLEESARASQAVQSMAADLALNTSRQENGTKEHAASVSQVTAAMIELREAAAHIALNISTVSKALDNTFNAARKVRKVTEQVITVSDSGQRVVGTSIAGIELARQKIEDLAEKLTILTERSQQISTIADLMSNIAKEIHLLGLNAAIESASTGQYGERFRAVAAEVRQLANHSFNAASQVRETVREVQQAISTAAIVAEEGRKETLNAVAMAYHSGEVINQLGKVVLSARCEADSIVDTVETTRALVTEIVLATQQQQSSSDQVVVSMSGIDILAREVAIGNANINQIVIVLQALSAQLNERSHIAILKPNNSLQEPISAMVSYQAA